MTATLLPVLPVADPKYKAAMTELGSIDTPTKTRLLQEILLEKWGGKLNGKYHPQLDWLGDPSVEAGFPKLQDDRAKGVIAMLLENQLGYQREHEPRLVGNRVIMQDTTTADEALPTKYSLPIVRRVYALMIQNDWSVTQPLPGPTGYVFWLDFIREADTTNLLYTEPNAFVTSELGVPPKGKLALLRQTITVQKQLLGLTWSLEALEDARAQLGLDVENELLNEFGNEFARNLFGRHLAAINAAATGGSVPVGTDLPSTPYNWGAANTVTTIPTIGAHTLTDYKSIVYNSLLDADTRFQQANRVPSNGIICNYDLAGFLRKMFTATSASNVDDSMMSTVGLTNFGVYEGRWTIWGTEFLPTNTGFLYRKNPDQLHAAHVYAPYIPVQVMPPVYGDYDATTGNYQNKDAWTRNIRERSGQIITKPYGFIGITAANIGAW